MFIFSPLLLLLLYYHKYIVASPVCCSLWTLDYKSFGLVITNQNFGYSQFRYLKRIKIKNCYYVDYMRSVMIFIEEKISWIILRIKRIYNKVKKN